MSMSRYTLFNLVNKIQAEPCKHDTVWTGPARTVKHGTHITYCKTKNPIDFQGQESKVKVKR